MSKRSRTTRLVLACLSLTAGASLFMSPGFAQQGFDEQRKAILISPATQSEQAIIALIKSGLAEHKPSQTIAVAQQWLRQNVAEDPILLYHAGQAAELSGDWKSASSLYRQYLTRADLKSQTASDAVLGVYTLLINQLSDTESAYAFAKSEGHRLSANAQARQFDRWFLNEAKRRNDRQAVALRLLALTQAKVNDDLLTTLYESDFHWLLKSINDGRLDQKPYSDRFVQTITDLAKATTFDRELALLLDWSVSVKVYNMAILEGEQATPPIAQAQALLKAYPRHAERVQTGWAGGNRGPHYRGDSRKYWTLDRDAKLAPVQAAVSKLDPLASAAFYQSYGTSYYSGRPQLVPAEEAAAWVLANPKIANSKVGPVLTFNWHSIKHEDAKKIAPLLAKNPSPEAAGIRAIAAVNDESKELAKAVDVLLKQEAWRLSPNELPGYIDRLWHRAGRPEGNAMRDRLIAEGKKRGQALSKTSLKKEAPANKRLAEFKKLWQDYRSASPKEIHVRPRLVQLLQITPEALPDLLRDPSLEASMLAREVMHSGRLEGTDPAWAAFNSARRISLDRYAPCFDEQARRHYGGMSRFVNNKEQYRPHPLGPTFHKLLEDQLKQNKVQGWVVFGWLNTQFPEDNARSVELMKRLTQSPAWKSLPFEARIGARRWFKAAAMTPSQSAYAKAADPQLICKPLLDLTEDADSATLTAALKATLDGLKKSPVRHEIQGLDRLGSKFRKRDNPLTDPALLEQVYALAGPMRSFQADPSLGAWLLSVVANNPEPSTLHSVAPFLWRHTEVHHRTLQEMIAFAGKLTEEHPSAAQSWARCGLQTIGRHTRGHTYFKRDSDIPALKAIRGKAALAMGLIEIPVPKSDPAYGVYQSQAEFTIGNEDSARELYTDHADQLMAIHKELSVSYLLWVLQVTIDNRDEVRQEELAKALMAWMQEAPTAFTLDQRVTLEIAYGDIALQRGLLPEAHKIFSRIRSNAAYEPVFARHTATLRRVLVERVSGDYDGALQTLMELDLEKIPRLTTAAHYARAEVYYAMEEFQDSADEIAKVLERDPVHSDATILRGRIQLKLQKLIEATEVELGSVTAQASLVPGEMLKVTLNDPTLAVSSGGTDIEVVVWASSGDKEHILLRQFGDEKTKYRGEVRTTLGEPKPDDKTLQIVGDDEIFYAYSEAFRKKMVNLGENRGGPITVASDAMMMASARKLLSENEQRAADMRAATEILEDKNRRSIENIDPETVAALRAEIAERQRKALLEARVKPGNPVHLRVIDPDRGRTGEIDELAVSLTSSSGDLVGRVMLKETEPFSGIFEGTAQTSNAQALAFGSSSQTGRNPNMVISPKDGYPAWRPVASKDAQHALTVDLNDNAAIGSLKIDASDDGFALKRFLVQTAMNHQNWSTVASYPAGQMAVAKPWNPNVSVAIEEGLRAPRGARSVYEINALRRHMSTGWLKVPDMAMARNTAGPSQMLPASMRTDKKWSWQGRDNNPAVVVKFEAYFYEPASITRRFALSLGKHANPDKNKKKDAPEFLIAVNGRVITKKESPKLEGQLDLKPGLHKLEVWATGWVDAIGFGRTVKVMANLDDPDEMADCPDSFFDPATFPEGTLDHRNGAAAITAVQDGTSFEVAFGSDSRARLVRLLFVEQQGPVPSINKLSLTGPGNEKLLPVPEDYAELRKNETLEIITGDRVTVRYVDDRYVTKGRQKHERFLNVAFTDGKAEFADIEPRFSSRHQKKMPYHEQLLRYAHDTPLSLVIHDADMDTTTEPDTVTCTVTSSTGQTRELTATETGPSTGTFRAWITPVGKATQDAKQIQSSEGGTLTLTYRDAENIRPGVPYDRVVNINHAKFNKPRIEIAHATIEDFKPEVRDDGTVRHHTTALNERLEPWNTWSPDVNREDYSDRIRTRFTVNQQFLSADDAPEGGLAIVHGRKALIDIVAPHMALGTAASIKVYVQTDAGRKAAGLAANAAFNPNAPGTLQLTGQLGTRPGNMMPERGGFAARIIDQRGNDYERIRLSQNTGRFRLVLPVINGTLPKRSYADPNEVREAELDYPDGLIARTGERIHIGVPYTDQQGKKQWATTTATVITRPFIDALDEDYRTTRESAHVGERLYLRVVDLASDTTSEPDSVRVYMASKSGRKHYFVLTETDPHSGVFKGSCLLTYATQGDDAGASEDYDVARQGFPVIYGDTLGLRYTDRSGAKTPVYYVQILKGSDGTIAPFSKQYSDDVTAMHTQFAMAESFLELARRHRKLKEEEQALREFARAKQLLQNAITLYNDPETRSHAEYLLGNLTMEDAQATEAGDLRDQRYQAALARFMTVTGSYPDTEYASKAQFQTAVIYERLREPDIAAQEYVKLAYKYPESEHLATAMARLGTHFQRKALVYEKKSKPLLEQEDNKDALFEGEAMKRLSQAEYIKAAQIFERLQERFPSDDLAGKAGLRSGQIYMRAEEYRSAIKALQAIVENEDYDGATLRAEAMYWSGICQQTVRQPLLAYALFKRITYDFPESKWAAYARSQLSSESMLRLDQRLEIERLEAGQ